MTQAALAIKNGASIICGRYGGSWEPLYARDAKGQRQALPTCFGLNAAAIDALNSAR